MKNLYKKGIALPLFSLLLFYISPPAWAGNRLRLLDNLAKADIETPYKRNIPYRLWEKIATEMAEMPQLQVSHFDRRFTFSKMPLKRIRLLQKEGRTKMVDYYAPASQGIISSRIHLDKNSVGGLVLARSTRDYRVIALGRKSYNFLLLGRVEGNRCRWDYMRELPLTGDGESLELTVVFRGPVLAVFVNSKLAYVSSDRPQGEIYRIGTLDLVDEKDYSGVKVSHIRHRKVVEDEFNNVSFLIWAHLQDLIKNERAGGYGQGEKFVVKPAIGKVHRTAFFLTPSSQISFPIEIPEEMSLKFGLGARSLGPLGDRFEEEWYFNVDLIGDDGRQINLLSQKPGPDLTRQWQDTSLDLSPYAGFKGRLLWSFKAEEDAIPRQILFLANPSLTGAALTGEKRPNVVLYVIDSLRADRLGSYGGMGGLTPAIDRWAENEILFKTCYTQAPWALPSLTSLFTSYYPYAHQTLFLGDKPGKDLPNLARILNKEGYQTAAFSENIVTGRISGLDRGFDLIDFNQITTKRLQEWIEENGPDPFFLYIHIQNPHLRYLPPDSFLPKGITAKDAEKLNETYKELAHPRSFSGGLREMMGFRMAFQEGLHKILPSIKKLYDSEVTAADYRFGELIGILKQLHLEDETLIILTSNHGEEFAEHEELLHGRSLYNTVLHVPLILHLPGPVRNGMSVVQPVGLIDILPTILDILGQDMPRTEGQSLLPAIFGDPAGGERKIFAVRNSFRIHSPERGKKNIAMIGRRWKAIYNQDSDTMELYDIISDPEELTDLAGDYPNQAQAYKEQIYSHLEDQGVKPQDTAEQSSINKWLDSVLKP